MRSDNRGGAEDQRSRFVPIAEMMPLICESIAAGGTVELNTRGVSMLPLLREGRDTVILKAPSDKLKVNDVILYRRNAETYVLHRIVKAAADGYVCIGDAQRVYERGVRDEQVIAVMIAYKRNGKTVSVDSFRYRFYCLRRRVLRWMRRLSIKVRRKLKRGFLKIFRRGKCNQEDGIENECH